MRSAVAVVGVGHSKVLRRDDVPLWRLSLEACEAAIADAGLSVGDIDGLASVCQVPFTSIAAPFDGLRYLTCGFLARALGITPAWMDQSDLMVSHNVLQAANAVAAGACDYALVCRALHSPLGRFGRFEMSAAEGADQFQAPYGAPVGRGGPTVHTAMAMQRYFDLYGATREQLGRFIVRNREQALKWEHGYWFQHAPETLTLDDYLGARMVADPLCLFDCDLPVQGAGAFVLTSAERARDLRHPPAYLRAIAMAPSFFGAKPDPDAGREMGRQLYARAGLGPGDVDLANLYDGFSIQTPIWAESLGFCGEGEGVAWCAEPTLPLNTAGGSLGAGRMHGVTQIMDGALQVMGRAGPRQVRDAAVSLVAIGPESVGVGMIFTRDP
jgi:acetyl-CoA acetyltransferase